jgi:SNF2 family DNA or RNA helicase
VVLTTYPLLWRDHEALEKQEYHMLILDEAQTVKNAGSQAPRWCAKLKARHRLCLTGTPLENHLGELWAQFDFLLPGFLGDAKSFTRTWRTPIEKQGDTLRRELLAKRLRPFILRRRKEEVAQELPPKTLILRTVELDGGQRDLYETVRSAMDARVREAIADLGFNRSQIVILDALLKLRQVCCDPRLLKSETAQPGEGAGQAGPAHGHAAGDGGGRPAHPAVLPVHLHAGSDPHRTGPARIELRHSHRRHHGPGNPDPPLPGRRGAHLPDQPQGRRRRP